MSLNFDNWKWIAEKLGVPTLFAVVLCFAIYKTGQWTATKVFEPLVQSHTNFLATEQEYIRAVANEVGKQTVHAERQTKAVENIERYTKETRDDQRKFPAVAQQMP